MQADTVSAHLDECSTCKSFVSELEQLSAVGKQRLNAKFLNEPECNELLQRLQVPGAAPPTKEDSTVSHGRYLLEEEIARGGMGAVLRGRDTDLGRDLAIKVLLDKHKQNPAVVRRFVEEAQIGGQLQHPGIAPVYELGRLSDQQPFFAMKLVKGKTLSTLLNAREDVLSDRSRFVGIFEQICQTMAYAHSRNVIHRDLKPANIMIGAFGEVQVMDWGLAKVILPESEREQNQDKDASTIVKTVRSGGDENSKVGSDVSDSETQMGSVIGTLAYMPPEQALGAVDLLDERADVFGLGAILCRILTGQPPYVAKKKTRLFEMASQGDLTECFERLDECGADGELIELTRQCLEPDREIRLRDAGVLAERVTGYLESVDTKLREVEVERAAESARADSEAARATAESARRRTSMALAASVLLLLGLGGGGWLYMERQESNRLTAEAEAERLHAEEMDKERSVAVIARDKAEAEEKRGRELLYATDMQLTPLLWKNPDVTLAQLRHRLDTHDPAANPDLEGKADLRGFEWYYYDNLLKNSASVFTGHTDRVVDARMDGDGDLITLTKGGQVRRWDLFSRQEDASRRLELSGGESIKSGALSFDGQKAAVIVNDRKTFRVCNTLTGQVIWQMESLGKGNHVCFSSDGKWVVAIDHKVQWLDANTGDVVGTYHLDLGATGKASLSHDGKTITLVNDNHEIRVCQFDEKAKRVDLLPFKVDTGAQAVAVSPDGATIARTSYYSTSIRLYDVSTGDLVGYRKHAHGSIITAFAFLPNSPQVMTAESEGTIKIWPSIEELDSGGDATIIFKGHTGPVDHLALSSNGTHLISSSEEEAVRVWDLNAMNAGVHHLTESQGSYGSLFSPDGRLIVTVDDHRVQFWDAATKQQLRHWRVAENGRITAVACSSESHLLAVGHFDDPEDPRISLWDIRTGQEIASLAATADLPDIKLSENSRAVGKLAFSPDGKYLVAGFGHPNIVSRRNAALPLKVWNVETRQVHCVLEGHTGYCKDLEFSADGTKLVSGSQDGTAIVWSADTWEAMHHLENPDVLTRNDSSSSPEHRLQAVKSVSFSPDGKTLAMGSSAANIHLWDVSSGGHLKQLSGHSDSVDSVDFAPDGITLASGSRDGSVRLWNTATRQELVKMDFAGSGLAYMRSLDFSSDGNKLLYGGSGTGFWSSVPVVGRHPEEFARRLRDLLTADGDFADSIRLYSNNLRLHESLQRLSSDDPRGATALAATRANWLASQERWEDAEAEIDRLLELDPDTPHKWLNANGLLRLAAALFQRGRLSECNQLLSTVAQRVDMYSPVEYRIDVELEQVEDSVVVSTVEPESAVARAGLRDGDKILRVNGKLTTPGTVRSQLSSDEESAKRILVKQANSEDEEIIVVGGQRRLLNEELRLQLERLQSSVDQKLTASLGNAAAHEFRGGLFRVQGDFVSEVTEYTSAIDALADRSGDTVDVNLARLYRSRADASLRGKQWQSAVDDYARIVTADTMDEALLGNQTTAKAGLILTDAVVSGTSFDIAQVQDPLGRLAIAHYLTYNNKELKPILQRQPRIGEHIGDLLSADGFWQQALAYYNTSLQAKPIPVAVFTKRAEVFERLGQWDKAEAGWAKASRQRSDLAFRRFKTDDTVQWDTTQSNPLVESLKFKFADGILKFGAKPNSQPKQLRITQTKLRIEDGATHRLSFQMRSADKCDVLVMGKRFDRKNLSIGLSEKIKLSPEFQPYQFTFVSQDAGAGNSAISFVIPKVTPGMVEMKDIVFMKISETNVQEIDPAKIEDSRLKRAVTFHQSGQLKSLGDIVNKHPGVNAAIGNLYADLNRWRPAIAFYSKAIDPESPKVWLLAKRAETHEKLKQWELAAVDWALASRQQTDIAFQRFKSSDEKPWRLQATKDSDASMTINDGIVTFGKTKGTRQSYDVRLIQRRLRLEDGATYMLRFKMKSPDACRVNVKAQISGQSEDSWLYKTFRAKPDFKDYEFTFVAQDVDHEKNVIVFDSGRGPGMIMLKDVVLMKIADAKNE